MLRQPAHHPATLVFHKRQLTTTLLATAPPLLRVMSMLAPHHVPELFSVASPVSWVPACRRVRAQRFAPRRQSQYSQAVRIVTPLRASYAARDHGQDVAPGRLASQRGPSGARGGPSRPALTTCSGSRQREQCPSEANLLQQFGTYRVLRRVGK